MILVYELLKYYVLYKKKRRYVLNHNYYINNNTNNILYKIPFTKKIDEYLNKVGNPYGLNVKLYFLVKIVMTCLFLFLSIINQVNIFVCLITVALSFSLVDILLFFNQKNLYSNIRTDLIYIVDSIYLQLSSNIPMNNILKNLHINCKTQVLKRSLINMSNVYEYTGYNMQTAVVEIKERFDVLEIDMLSNALIEQTMLGDNLALFENLSDLLYEKNYTNIKRNTRNKVIVITIGIAISLLNICLLVFYPIMYSFSESFSNIFG